jgi:hypothetical protein
MIVSALREYDKFPAQFPQIFGEVMAVRERNNINATDKELRELLNEASRSNILPMISPYGTRPRLFELTKDAEAISAFVGEPSSRATRAENAALAQAQQASSEAELVEEESADEAINPFDLLVEAVKGLIEDQNSTVLATVKRRMRQLDGSFDEKKLKGSDGNGYKRFTDFVQDGVQQGYVATEGKGRTRRVVLHEKANKAATVPASEPMVTSPIVTAVEEPTVEAVAAETAADTVQEVVVDTVAPAQDVEAQSDTLAAEKSPLVLAFELIAQAVADSVKEDRSQRLTAIRGRMVKIDSAFEARDLQDESGNNFSSFSAFAKAAEQAGYIKLSGKGLQLQAHLK